MEYKIVAMLCALLSMTACASMSEITPIGKDTYMIANSSVAMGEGGGNLKAKLIQEASRFCATQSKLLMLVGFSSADMAFGRPASADITFRCLLENDPEYIRPNIKYENNPGSNSTPGVLMKIN
jgi:hypothetical protein